MTTRRPAWDMRNVRLVLGAAERKTIFENMKGTKGVLYVGRLFTGDKHPSEVRVNGGTVTIVPTTDITPMHLVCLIRAFHKWADQDHLWRHNHPEIDPNRGWGAWLNFRVDIDDVISEIMAETEIPLNESAQVRYPDFKSGYLGPGENINDLQR
jgi:hypothetical protein